MPTFRKKRTWKKKSRPHKTGEDIEMLFEDSLSPQSGSKASSAYKDHIDGA